MERTLRGSSEETHEELKMSCERFERGVEQARSAPLQSVTPHGLYELGGLAAACSDALARFRRTRVSGHEERYEALVAAANDECEEKRSALTCYCLHSIEQIQSEIAPYAAKAAALGVGRAFREIKEADPADVLEAGRAATGDDHGPGWSEALTDVRRRFGDQPVLDEGSSSWRSAVAGVLVAGGSWLSWASFLDGLVTGFVAVVMVGSLSYSRTLRAKEALRRLASAATQEFHQMKRARSDALAKAAEEREQKADNARSTRDSAMNHVDQQCLSFDDRLCRSLDDLELLWNEWAEGKTMPIHARLDAEDRHGEDHPHSCPRWTRLGMTSVRGRES